MYFCMISKTSCAFNSLTIAGQGQLFVMNNRKKRIQWWRLALGWFCYDKSFYMRTACWVNVQRLAGYHMLFV
ncbi:hypothetical protein XENTR_v10021028 [Xenopus tropicalis]|nr:hypothetical protein XENTR_v10021028 [Xenopus tropicalis]